MICILLNKQLQFTCSQTMKKIAPQRQIQHKVQKVLIKNPLCSGHCMGYCHARASKINTPKALGDFQ